MNTPLLWGHFALVFLFAAAFPSPEVHPEVHAEGHTEGPAPNPAMDMDFDPRFQRIDSLFAQGALGEALREVEGVLTREPAAYEALWRGASIAVAIGVTLEEGKRTIESLAPGSPPRPSDPEEWYRRAGRWADDAIRVRPVGTEGRYWRIAVLGREALRASGPREASDLSDQMRALALSILDDDPNHPGAHNALGRVYLEIMSVGGVTRLLGRTLVRGEALSEASWSLAEHHLRRAVTLAPASAMYRLDLGRYHLARGARSQARSDLEAVVRIGQGKPAEEPFVAEARRLLNGNAR